MPGHSGPFLSLEVQLIQLIPIFVHLALVPIVAAATVVVWAICYLIIRTQYLKSLTQVLSLWMQQKQHELPAIWLKITKSAAREHLTTVKMIFFQFVF